MSCILLPSNHLYAVACGITAAVNVEQSFNYQLMDGEIKVPLYTNLIDCRKGSIYLDQDLVYKKLAEINIDAYNYRYKENITFADFSKPDKQKHLTKALKRKNGHFVLENSSYEWIKLLESYLYQCCEDNTYNNPIIKTLEKLRDDYYKWLIRNTDEYENADWIKQ